MLSMLKLLATIVLLSSALLGADLNKKVEDFLEKSFKQNPNIIALNVKVVDRIVMQTPAGWDALIVTIDATLKGASKNREIKQKMVWFTNGDIITKELTNLNTGASLADSVTPSLKAHHYKKANLIYGNENAKYKIAIFSDPLCPFCRNYVPGAIEFMKKSPNKFAIYYYHFPLKSLHPAAVELTKAAIAAELKGYKDTVLKLYTVEVDARERDVSKILKAFNEKLGTDIKPSDLKSKAVLDHVKHDMQVADDVMVQGTPTMFFDGKVDKSKRKYMRVK